MPNRLTGVLEREVCYDSFGREVPSDSPDCVATTKISRNGGKFYFIREYASGKAKGALYNHLDYTEHDSISPRYRSVSKSVFEHYLNFLFTQTLANYRLAQREQ